MPQAAGPEAELAGQPACRAGLHSGLAGKAAAPVTEALLRRMEPFRDRTRTLTADHGKEFAGRYAGFCFATPCHSWERGLNEHANGLVRQYFPKGTDFRQVTPEQVKQVAK